MRRIASRTASLTRNNEEQEGLLRGGNERVESIFNNDDDHDLSDIRPRSGERTMSRRVLSERYKVVPGGMDAGFIGIMILQAPGHDIGKSWRI